jgi:hypothetical protein
VLAIVDELRGVHPELMQPLRWRGLQRILEREGISVGYRAIPQRAFVQGFDGDFHITVRADLSARVVTKVVAHEYGHAVLHMTERGEVVRQLHECARGDTREREADLFAALLWFGPAAGPDTHPVIAQLIADIEAPRFIHPAPAQIPLPLPEPAPVYRRPKRHPQSKSKNRKWWVGRRPAVGIDGVSHDALRFNWDRGGKPLAFFHYDLGWIDVYDRAVIEHDGRRRAVLLRCGDKRTQQRIFVVSSSDRRRYTFADGETRGRSIDELNAQIAKASSKSTVRPTSGSHSSLRKEPR